MSIHENILQNTHVSLEWEIDKLLKFEDFGALMFAHIKQDTFGVRGVKCVFISYPKGMNGYKLWKIDPRGTKCIINRDVTFDETRMKVKCKDMSFKKL